jgi:1,4-alpha-glucan branching enzyme
VARSGQLSEWGSRRSVDWQPLSDPAHHGIWRWIIDLNRLYASEPALHELDFEAAGFSCVDANDWDQSVVSIMRSSSGGRHALGVFNFTSVPRPGYRACPRVGSGASCSPATPSSRAARAAAAGAACRQRSTAPTGPRTRLTSQHRRWAPSFSRRQCRRRRHDSGVH